MKKPNIIFVECDSMDGRAMGAMGLQALRNATPAMDSLAREGVMYDNFYTNNPICCCSRASMLAGQYTFNCHAWNNYKGIPASQPTLFSELESGGYNSAIFGKTDYVSGAHTIRARVTAWLRSLPIERPEYNMGPPILHETQERRVHKDWRNVDASINWLKQAAQKDDGKPFFLYLGLNAPHPQLVSSRYYMDQIDQEAIEIPPQDENEHPALRIQRLRKAWAYGGDDESIRFARAMYYAMVAETDAMLSDIMDAAHKLDLLENTYIIFTSDHGECNMEHGQFYKSNMYEPSMRIPLLIRGPQAKPGLRISRCASLIDIFPTLMTLGGIKTDVALDGHCMAGEIAGRGSDRPDLVYGEYYDGPMPTSTAMVRQGDWKYVAFADGYEPQLFDLSSDPWEVSNLAKTMPEKVAQMRQLMEKYSDLEAVNSRVREYEQDSFRIWRQEQLAAGTYHDNMSRIYSGWDGIAPEDIRPWSDEDEKMVLEWLEKMP